MAQETPPKKRRKRFRRLIPDSLEGKATLAVAVVLPLTVLVVWTVRWIGRDNVSFSHAISWSRMVTELGLSVLVPIVLYWGLHRWNQVTEGLFPDIDRAWKAGIDALKSNGIATDELPIFLILGSVDSELEGALVNASISSPAVHGIPNEVGIRHALQWYAGEDGIYLFCPGASSLSALVRQWDRHPTARMAAPRPLEPSPPVAVSESKPPNLATLVPTHEEHLDRPTQPPASSTDSKAPTSPPPTPVSMQTIDSSQLESEQPTARGDRAAGVAPDPTRAAVKPRPTPVANSDVEPSLQNASRPYETIVPDQIADDRPAEKTATSDRAGQPPKGPEAAPRFTTTTARIPHATGSGQSVPRTTETDQDVRPRPEVQPRVSSRSVALPRALDTSDQLARLQYVCRLLRRIRRPWCGINGIVTLIPFQLSQVGAQNLAALAQSARGDLETIQQTLGLRCPVTALLIGLEQDRGFHELVRRLRAELLSRRLGGRFDLRTRPTPAALNDHSDRLCDAFEDWIYRLFHLDDALSHQRGNRTLYRLLSRIRHDLKPRLRIVLGRVFGCEPTSRDEPPDRDDSSFFFSGCYFASSEATAPGPAFVKGVLHDKLVEEQAQVEWTKEAIRVQRRSRWFAITGWLLFVFLTASLLFLLVTNG